MIAEMEGRKDLPKVVVFIEKGMVARILVKSVKTSIEVVDYDDQETDKSMADQYGDLLVRMGYKYHDE